MDAPGLHNNNDDDANAAAGWVIAQMKAFLQEIKWALSLLCESGESDTCQSSGTPMQA